MQEEHRAAPLAALDGSPMPAELHFVRSHFPAPDGDWTLEVGGAVARPLALSADDVRRFGEASQHVVLECAGHRRTELSPPVEGLPWGVGAVSQGLWTGAPLARVLAEVEPRPEAAYVVLTGADGEGAFARAISLAKARDEATLIAWALDGAPVPRGLGGPLRALVPGHYAVDSVKWLQRIEVVTEPFRGHFQAADYCLFGAHGVEDGMQLAELPVTSLVTSPEPGDLVDPGERRIAGVAWGGRGAIATVEVAVDGGSGRPADLREPLGPYAFVPWELTVDLEPGERTVAARATDAEGNVQPAEPLWNRRGYANSSIHHVTVTVGKPS